MEFRDIHSHAPNRVQLSHLDNKILLLAARESNEAHIEGRTLIRIRHCGEKCFEKNLKVKIHDSVFRNCVEASKVLSGILNRYCLTPNDQFRQSS